MSVQYPFSADLSEEARPGQLVVPAVELEGGNLYWDWVSVNAQFSVIATPADLLVRFASLSDADDEAVLAFAQKFGTLQLCEHQLPFAHSTDCTRAFAPVIRPGRRYVEPVDRWRHFAREARALVEIAATLHSRKLPGAGLWRDVFTTQPRWWKDQPWSVPWWERGIKIDRLVLAVRVREWLQLGDVRLRFGWSHADPSLDLEAGGLFGELAIRLALTTLAKGSITTCSACGRPYVPSRQPRADQQRYCAVCRKSGADRRYARNAYQLRLRSPTPLQRIATAGVTGGTKRPQVRVRKHKKARQSPF